MKCAILGCRGRARAHASAYQDIERGHLAAICDMNVERLNEFGQMFDVDQRDANIHQMLEKEKPDLLHIVTTPILRGTNALIRYPLLKIAADHQVPGVIIEIPIAVMREDYRPIQDLAGQAKTKVAVNTQLHFPPPNLELKQDVAAGKIGNITLIDASCRNPPVDQAPHTLQLVFSHIDNSLLLRGMGKIANGHLNSDQPSPDSTTARIEYANGVQAPIVFGPELGTQMLPDASNSRHKRVCGFGTQGFVHWRFESWEKFTPANGYQEGDLSYSPENSVAQANLTEATFDWLEDDQEVHPTNLQQSLAGFNLLLGIYQSGLTNQPIEFPFDPADNLIQQMKEQL